jgi:hypothetical protein
MENKLKKKTRDTNKRRCFLLNRNSQEEMATNKADKLIVVTKVQNNYPNQGAKQNTRRRSH